MSPTYPRWHVSIRYAAIVFAVLIVCALPRYGSGQAPSDEKKPLTYVKPPAGVKPFVVDRIAGQIVFAPPSAKGLFSALGIPIALFNEKDEQHVPVSNAVSGDHGQFDMKDVPPGAYTLVVGEDTLHLLSIPLRVRTSTPERAPVVSALLLKMRSKTDRRESVAAPITNNTLRTELLERVAKDQAVRNEWVQHGVDHPDNEIEARMGAVDADNLARMKEIVRQYHWPGLALVGMDGTEAAFLLVQHAPHTFQKEMLPLIRRAYRSNELAGQDYALLLDRVLVGDGKPQVYGTQAKRITEWKNGEPALDPIEDEAHVDQRRAEVGLFPLAEYVKVLKKMYYPHGTEKSGNP